MMKKYDSIDSLPTGVKENLPKHAQEIYKSTFNNALVTYSEEEYSESIAHRIAWSAVKQVYEQTGSGKWQKK